MKENFRRVCLFALLALAAFGPSMQAAPEPVDPLIGNWLWYGDVAVTIHADGTTTSEQGGRGTWTYLHNPEVQRHYRVIWNHGESIDDVALTEDGQVGHTRNLKGVRFDIRRALPDKPIQTPTVPGASAAKPAPANDPVIGDWLWRGTITVAFKADGTLTSNIGLQGSWTFLNNPETERKYQLVWEHGKYTDNMICSRDGQQANIRNNKGEHYDVRRALSDKAANPFGSTSR